jgi:hypothetical protein
MKCDTLDYKQQERETEMYKVVIHRPQGLDTVGYYENKISAEQALMQIKVYAKHNFKVEVIEFSEEEMPKFKKSNSLLGVWL